MLDKHCQPNLIKRLLDIRSPARCYTCNRLWCPYKLISDQRLYKAKPIDKSKTNESKIKSDIVIELVKEIKKVNIKIKYFDKNMTRLEKIQKGDWIDLRARENIVMEPGDFKLIPLGVAMELPNGYEAHVLPRSSTFKKWGIIMTNSMGVIDNSYSGDGDEWLFPALAMRDTIIYKGDRIAQFRIVENQPRVDIVEVEKLDGANRGGIGSTGKR